VPKVSQQYRDARQETILAAARRCFARDGFHETSMQDLFTESGLSAGAFYRYFASKDQLILAIAEDNIRDVVTAINAIATNPSQRSIGGVLAEIVELVRQRTVDQGLAGLAVQVWAESLRDTSLAAQVKELLTQLRGELVDLVRWHQSVGNLPTDVPAADLAGVLIATVAGHILQLAILGPDAIAGHPTALRALWPANLDSVNI
jgi:TetR/AcrR family transcriptional regulator, transcriptional repressor of aconitase